MSERKNISKAQRVSGIFLLCCSAICLIIAINKRQNLIQTGSQVAESMGLKLESTGLPFDLVVTVFIGIVFLVAGLRLIWDSRKKKNPDSPLIEK